MKLAVSILNFRTPDLTIKAIDTTLTALEAMEDWWVYVVDNNSQDGSEETLRAIVSERQAENTLGWDRVEVIQTHHNGGFGAGNNFAIHHARAVYQDLEYVYVLNSDAFPDKDAIKVLVEYLDDHSDYCFAGSYIYGTDGIPHETAFRFPSILGEFEGAIRFGPVSKILNSFKIPIGMPEASCDVDWLAGASMMMRVSALEKIGTFDETFFLYFEETDLCKRASRLGWKIRYVKESKVAHVGSASTGMKKWERIPGFWLDSRKHYLIKNHGRLYFFLATTLKIMGNTFFKIRCGVTKKPNPDPKCFSKDLLQHAFK